MRMAVSINIPLEDDLAVYARAVQSFYARRTVENLAILVLCQRVLVERVKSHRKAVRRAEIYLMIERVNADPLYRSEKAAAIDSTSALAKMHPKYVQAGLIPNR